MENFKHIFVLCTGRCGSTTFWKACSHIQNYTSGHETLSREFGESRLKYPSRHIEVDNRLSWFLGSIEEQFESEETLYIHLLRERKATIESFNKRWSGDVGIVKAFSQGILMKPVQNLTEKEKLQICGFYYDTVNKNITQFISDKPHRLSIDIDSAPLGFTKFWSKINALGNIDMALSEFDRNHNASVRSGSK